MTALNPKISSLLAKDVYALTRASSVNKAISDLNYQYGPLFNFNTQNLLRGRTGGPSIIKVRTGFGFTLIGQGKLKGEAVILFRGTQYLADWLSNVNVGTSSSIAGLPVHDGFNMAFIPVPLENAGFRAWVGC